MEKIFVVLVRSIKNGKYCVAGREVEIKDGKLHVGRQWFRPVNPANQGGAMAACDITLQDGYTPRFLDVIRCKVHGVQDDAIQKENWVVDTGASWQKLGEVRLADVYGHIIERPESLWMGSDYRSDRISQAEYQDENYQGSLCLVEAENLCFTLESSLNYNTGITRESRKVSFDYRGQNYKLSLTDADTGLRYFGKNSSGNLQCHKNTVVERALMVVSLTPEFYGYHYKIAAHIIEI